MKAWWKTVVGIGALCVASVACAGDKGTADEAVALVKSAIADINKRGMDKVFEDINKQSPQFSDRDLYVLVMDLKGKILSHGANPKLIGKDVSEIKDAEGKYFIQDFLKVAKTKGSGWVDYIWVNPVTKGLEKKATYVQLAGPLIVACGIYK
ncbi:cache domain-containing protein [Massilia endophytica]|uniref:cache domain-containing protein n=1 Tax=Massilia endophytica TaxID=2899220 RepID=UPI001E4313AF|nr:cache domain-containing protein [Massilia endophytica]UGQ44568.1 cache domain-containing protein [Massilia endophytica]